MGNRTEACWVISLQMQITLFLPKSNLHLANILAFPTKTIALQAKEVVKYKYTLNM